MNKIIETLKDKARKRLRIGEGTLNDLNQQKEGYPLMWLVYPVSVANNTNGTTIVSQTFNFQLMFLQSGLITNTEKQINDFLQEMNKYMVGFIQSVMKDVEDNDDEPIIFGNATQIHKKQDNIHYGWSVNVSVTVPIDSDLCCSLYD